jgi:hypothetical protein
MSRGSALGSDGTRRPAAVPSSVLGIYRMRKSDATMQARDHAWLVSVLLLFVALLDQSIGRTSEDDTGNS